MIHDSGVNMSKNTELEEKLGIQFKNKDLLSEALTHRSFLNEPAGRGFAHNERLEFLGDAVLELSVTNFLFVKFPEKPEGELTSLRSALVNSNMLFEVSEKLELKKYIRLSKGEAKDTGKGRQYILSNSVEAIIGAIYLDQGYEKADDFILKYFCSNLENVLEKKLWRDAKSLFQEKAQKMVGITPDYKVVEESGPDHERHFVIGVYLGGEMIANGEGFSKQEAQMKAAEKALEKKGWEE